MREHEAVWQRRSEFVVTTDEIVVIRKICLYIKVLLSESMGSCVSTGDVLA